MSIQEQKITEAAIAANGVQSRPDKLTGTAAQNKKVFDALVTAVVREKFNALLDELTGTTAAAQLGIGTIPGFSADNIQTVLEEIVTAMQEITQGSVADRSITLAKLAAEVTAVALGGAAASHTHGAGDVSSGVLDEARIPALTGDKLPAGVITAEKLGAAAVTGEKIAALAVLATHLAQGAVTTQKLADKAVTSAKIANAAVGTTQLATGAANSAVIADKAVTAAKLAADAVKLTFTNKSVAASSFASNSTYADFPYRAAVALTGVTAAMVPEVFFGLTDAMSGNFAPVAESYAGGIYIYAAAKPSAAVTIPTILCWR